jgi:putative transposase
MEANVHGISTRAVDDLVDDLVEAMGVETGISKSEVSRVCTGLDEVVGAFPQAHAGAHRVPLRLLDATYLNVGNGTGQVVSMAVILATGIAADGSREILDAEHGGTSATTRTRRLARLPHLAQAARPRRRKAGHQRPARTPGQSLEAVVPGCRTSALPRAYRGETC